MTLLEVINRLDELPEEAVIYAGRINGRWVAESPAWVEEEPEDDTSRQVYDGVEAEYLLEVFLAKEAVEAYQEHHGTLRPSPEEKLKAIIYYAEHDTYLPSDPEP